MRVNVYAEEITQRVEIVEKIIDGQKFTGLRFYLYLPVTTPEGWQIRGPFTHREGDDDSAAITIWGKTDFSYVLKKALELLDEYYDRNKEEEKSIKYKTDFGVTDKYTETGLTLKALALREKQVVEREKDQYIGLLKGLKNTDYNDDKGDNRVLQEVINRIEDMHKSE